MEQNPTGFRELFRVDERGSPKSPAIYPPYGGDNVVLSQEPSRLLSAEEKIAELSELLESKIAHIARLKKSADGKGSPEDSKKGQEVAQLRRKLLAKEEEIARLARERPKHSDSESGGV